MFSCVVYSDCCLRITQQIRIPDAHPVSPYIRLFGVVASSAFCLVGSKVALRDRGVAGYSRRGVSWLRPRPPGFREFRLFFVC